MHLKIKLGLFFYIKGLVMNRIKLTNIPVFIIVKDEIKKEIETFFQ